MSLVASVAKMPEPLSISGSIYFLFLLNSSLGLAGTLHLATELSHILCNMQMSPSLFTNHSEGNLIDMQQCFSAKGNH